MTRDTKEPLDKTNTEARPESVNSRRRLLMSAGISSSLLLTVTSRPAWAQAGICTASAMASANASGGFYTEGCSVSADWWKELENWPISPATPFHAVTPSLNLFNTVRYNGNILYNGLTLGEVINFAGNNNTNPGGLALHLIGALMNALTFPRDQISPGFVYTAQEVISLYNALDGQNMPSFKALSETLEAANNQFNGSTQRPVS